MSGMSVKVKETKSYELWLYANLDNADKPMFRFKLKDKKDSGAVLWIPDTVLVTDKWICKALHEFFNEI